jgi:hypothetical protein
VAERKREKFLVEMKSAKQIELLADVPIKTRQLAI